MGSAVARKKIVLIPWDFDSPEHVDRLVVQRIACGWRAEEVPAWKEKAAKGLKGEYWIVLADDCPDREATLAYHVSKYPDEKLPLKDTATRIINAAREPTGRSFIPVGHVAMDIDPEELVQVKQPGPGVAYIKALYISWFIQQGGLGGSTMAELHRIAAGDPYNAHTVILDTLRHDVQMNEDFLQANYTVPGYQRPSVSNEAWYIRQGYVPFREEDDIIYPWHNPRTGKIVDIHTIWLKKSLAKPTAP